MEPELFRNAVTQRFQNWSTCWCHTPQLAHFTELMCRGWGWGAQLGTPKFLANHTCLKYTIYAICIWTAFHKEISHQKNCLHSFFPSFFAGGGGWLAQNPCATLHFSLTRSEFGGIDKADPPMQHQNPRTHDHHNIGEKASSKGQGHMQQHLWPCGSHWRTEFYA